MNRRHLLGQIGAGALVGIAGCFGPTDEPDPGEESTPEEESDQHHLSIDEDPVSESPLLHSVKVLQSNLRSPDIPLTIEVSVTNVTDESIAYGERRTVLGMHLMDQGFILFPKEDHPAEFDEEARLWSVEGPLGRTGDYQVAEVGPGETHTQELILMFVESEENKLPETAPSDFEFELQFAAQPAGNHSPDDQEYSWGFSLRQVDVPESKAIEDVSCPPFEHDYEQAVCSHSVDTDTAPVYLLPSQERTILDDGTPAEEISLTLYNHSSDDLTFNPDSWGVWKNQGTGWEEMEQQISGDSRLTVSSGTTHSWQFMEALESIQEAPDIEPGLYAAGISVPSPESSDQWVSCMALVSLFSPI